MPSFVKTFYAVTKGSNSIKQQFYPNRCFIIQSLHDALNHIGYLLMLSNYNQNFSMGPSFVFRRKLHIISVLIAKNFFSIAGN